MHRHVFTNQYIYRHSKTITNQWKDKTQPTFYYMDIK